MRAAGGQSPARPRGAEQAAGGVEPDCERQDAGWATTRLA